MEISNIPPERMKLTYTYTPENGWLEDQFPFGKAYFPGELLVSGEGSYVVFLIWRHTRAIGMMCICPVLVS